MSTLTMAEMGPGNEARTAESLIADLERLRASPCSRCAKPLSSHLVLMSLALGFKDSLQCLPCLGESIQYDPSRIRDTLWQYIRSKDSFLTAWNWASRSAGLPENIVPDLLLTFEGARNTASQAPVTPAVLEMPSATWDAGEMTSSDVVSELPLRLQDLRPGEVLQLRALDPGAREYLPAWCRRTGHILVRADPPGYWIKRKESH